MDEYFPATLFKIPTYSFGIIRMFVHTINLINIAGNIHVNMVFKYNVLLIKKSLSDQLCRYLICIIYTIISRSSLCAFYFHLPSFSSIKQCSKRAYKKYKVKYRTFVAFNGLNKCPRSYYKYKLHTKKVR